MPIDLAPCKIIALRSLVPAVLLVLATLASGLRAATNYGPNLLPNSSFEGGSEVWVPSGPFSIVKNAANAHTGSWELQAALTSTPTYQYCYQTATVWPNTNYVSTLWIKGSGTVQFGVLNTTNYQFISTVNVTATSTWHQVTLPWNSGACSSVWIFVYDSAAGNSATTVYLDDCQTFLANGGDIHFNPASPAASGFIKMFDDEFGNAGTIDSKHTGATGYNWYVGQYFGAPTTPTSMYSLSGGVLTVQNSPAESIMTLHTTEPDSLSGKGFHGTVFSGGSGIYMEGRIALENLSSITSSSWPAFWSEDLKPETGYNEQMPGKPLDYEFIEDDFMEYNPTWGNGNAFGSAIHDFSGTFASGPSYDTYNSNFSLPVPVGTDYTKWHKYGLLWVPASAANGWIGYRQAFFDGVAQDALCWQGNQVGTFPPSGSYLFSLKDKDQFDVIFGGPTGAYP